MRSTKRAWPSSELPPLTVDDGPGRNTQRLTKLSKNADVGPKVYPRLKTLTQLADKFVRDLHTGNFVARSEMRWQSFDGLDSRNSARDRSISTVKQSAALVIQCAWRRYAAVKVRELLAARMWRRQLDIAARITRHSARLTHALQVMMGVERPRLRALASVVPICGFYLHAPAQLLSWWLGFTCAQLLVRRRIRHPLASVRAADLSVKLTRGKLAALWRCVVPLAVVILQCRLRVFLARREIEKRRLQRLELEAALRLQRFIRVDNARHIARRLRRRCAVIRIQCQWRCHRSRRCLQQRRLTRAATCVCTPLILQAARQATAKLRLKSARILQKYYRGGRARAQFRELLGCHEQQRWRRNPSKGFDFFELKRYDQAALYLETCFRQGIFTDEEMPVSQPAPTDEDSVRNVPHQKLVSGSRMSFSFSTAPTQLGTDWIRQRDTSRDLADSTSDFARLARRLHFWQAYAISHLTVFEATGNLMNLKQARVGWESYLQVDTVARTWPPFQSIAVALNELRIRSRYELAKCLFWSGKHSEKETALGISLTLLQEIPPSDDDATPADAANLKAQLLMLSGMLYFEQDRFAKSCTQLEKLLDTPSQNVFSDLEIRFTLALVLLKRYEMRFASRNNDFKTDDSETDTLLRTAALLLKQCYQVIELWPSVGFYHGWLKKSEAKRLLATEQIGSFLLHHAAADGKSPTSGKATRADKLLLQVKRSERPLRIASMRIDFTATGRYKTRRRPDHLGHFSLHELVRDLPPEAGIQLELGVRKALYAATLQKKLEQTQSGLLQEKVSLRSRLLHWSEWERKINDTAAMRGSETARRWKRRNETWSAACFEVAKLLECSEAWIFAELAASEALVHSKDRSLRANGSFLAARVALNMQKRNEGALLMQQARLEVARERRIPSTPFFIDNLAAVQRALSLNVSLSRQEPFSSRLERVQKLERLCLKAWRCDSLTPRLRGNPFHEALLLQRIADEMYADCGDTFFIRSLLKAHIRAYVMSTSWHESLHLKCAYACVAQLFERFHKHQDAWTAQLANLANHIGGMTQSKRTWSKSRTFDMKLLLLSWHHMPFLLCFEMAEVLYRYKSRSASTLIDVYESLQGRLRGSQPRTCVYAAYEELILLRLSFLHAAKVSQTEHSWRHLNAAVSALDEILEQRRERARLFTSEAVKKRAKRIKWPCCIRLPFDFSDGEILFLRGFFRQFQEEMTSLAVERRGSWRDFHVLHHELMELVRKSAPPGEVSRCGGRILNSVRYRADNIRGLRVFVGATHDVTISNMLLSQPFVAIRHEGKTTPTRTPPTWTNLSPSWEEDVEVDVEVPASSANTTVTISMMNRTRRNSRWQDADTIGCVSVSMHELLAAHDGITEGKYYELTLLTPSSQRPSSGSGEYRSKVAQIFLSFQVLVKPQPMLPPSAKRTATWATRSGNWDVEDVRVHLHGDLREFVSNRWIWSRFANLFDQDHDLFIAKWFFAKSVRLTPELQRRPSKVGTRLNTTDSLAVVNDLMGLCRCYRASPSDLRWGDQAAPLLAQAETILTRRMSQQKRESCSLSDRASLEKQLADVRERLADARGTPRRIGPLEEAMARKVPATSEWIKLTSRKPTGGILTRYLNQDTGEIFQSKWRLEPLEYEDKEVVMMEEQERLPHRIVVMTSEMKARVSSHRQEMLQVHAEDPFQWVAVFNDRKKEIQFFSPHFPEAFSSRNDSKYPARPPSYVMLADEFLLYHVLLVQDAYRRYSSRRRRHRRLRGVLMSAWLISCELVAARRRVFLRSLNCIRVVVEKAQHLRAGDLLTSDPFVVLALTDPAGDVVATAETSVRYNSLNPKWNEEFHFRYSFEEHQEQRDSASTRKEGTGQLREAALTLKVFDHDIVSAHNSGNSDQVGGSHDSGDEAKDPDDFLGMVSIPIQSFIHGKRMTADLALLNERGGNSPRTRGSLTVSVQWTHSQDEDVTNAAKLWAIGSGGGRALIEKKANDKPALPEAAARELHLLRQHMEQLLQLLLSMATDVLEPMHRLLNRVQIAQAKGKTAEEAKTLEKRLDALLHTQLLPKLKCVRDLAAQQLDSQLPVVLKKLFGPIEEYLSSFDQRSRRELRSEIEKCLDELNATMYSLKAVPVEGATPVEALAMALDQHIQVKAWNSQLGRILTTFFAGDDALWQFTVEDEVDDKYWKLPGGGGEGKAGPRPATAAAVAKRKERIERAKQEKAWYEL